MQTLQLLFLSVIIFIIVIFFITRKSCFICEHLYKHASQAPHVIWAQETCFQVPKVQNRLGSQVVAGVYSEGGALMKLSCWKHQGLT